MLKPGNILHVNTGYGGLSSRIYQIDEEFYDDNGRHWLVCHLFYKNAPHLDNKNYHMKAYDLEKYVEWGADSNLRALNCIFIDEADLAKFLLERD